MRRLALVVLVLPLLSGCGDDLTPPREPSANQSSLTPANNPAKAVASLPLTASGFLAEEVPEFARAYRGDDGALVVTVTHSRAQTSASEAAKALLRSGNRPSLSVKVGLARYSYRQLHAWLLSTSPVFIGVGGTARAIDERRNLVWLGVSSSAWIPRMRAAAVGLGIPADAFAVEVAAPAVDLANLHSKQRPLRAGFRTTGFFTQDGVEREKACTQGPNVTYDNAKHYVVNAHCTEHDTKNGYIGAAFYQPVVGRYNHAGDEVIDVAYNWFTGCPTGSLCRYSDAALVRVPGALFPWEIAAIGKPQVRVLLPGDSGSMDILDADPKFTLTGVLSALFVGDTLEKVGRKTGWTAGVVESTCVDQATSGSPYVQLCNIRVAAGAGGGDSGSPVFFKSTSGTYHLAGLLWGGLLVPGSEKGVTFFASNWRYVSIELGGSMYALDPINPPSTDPPCEPPNQC